LFFIDLITLFLKRENKQKIEIKILVTIQWNFCLLRLYKKQKYQKQKPRMVGDGFRRLFVSTCFNHYF
jgi:hypothetical protein